MRFDADDVDRVAAAVTVAAVPLRVRHTHHRSSSCDVKLLHNDEPNSAKFRRSHGPNAGGGGHSRNNSRDVCSSTTSNTAGQEFRHKLTHSRTNSSDRHSSNIKFILNYLNTPKMIVPPAAAVRGHMRNHSYDQIYASAGIRIDGQLQRRINQQTAVAATLPPCVQQTGTASAPPVTATGLNQSGDDGATPPVVRDLNVMGIVLTEDAAGNSVLRHRRTGSRDLAALSATTESTQSPQHSAADRDRNEDGAIE